MVYTFNPLQDSRWPAFVDGHVGASVFHRKGWLDALWRTYRYEPIVYSTSPPNTDLKNGVVLCRVNSWITGRRLVSVPFADHCEPLVDEAEDRSILFSALVHALHEGSKESNLKYVEIRPRRLAMWEDPTVNRSANFAFHVLDLRPSLEELYARIHKSTLQRKIVRAARESLSYEAGRSDALLAKFYKLLLLTRRRHGLPPQPMQWFENLTRCMSDQLTIRVASKNSEPLASVLTLSHRGTMVYKYGCSDARYHNLGAMPFLLWRSIEEGKALGLQELDLGRSEPDHTGLITFKDRWGAARTELTYLRCSRSRPQVSPRELSGRVVHRLFAWMPDRMLETAGKLIYRHIG
jgi:hypothetical protein